MARVYRAQDNLLRRMIALKVLAPQLALDAEYIERFEREAIIAATLDHPNIVRIYDVYEHDGLRCIAMEFIGGRSLHAVISERGALGLAFAITICTSVGAALDMAHSKGAVHRDIKPHNIMLGSDGRVMLTDFGIAQAPETRDSGRLTRTGFFMGTPEYISPEQASAQRVDGRSDLYSLGITAYEIITGKVPFVGATPQLMLAHLQTPPPALSSIDPRQPPELDLVLARALAKNPDQRYQTADSFAAALGEVALAYQITAATPADLALLVRQSSSEGQGTISISREITPAAQVPAARSPSQPRTPIASQPPTARQYQQPQRPSTIRPSTNKLQNPNLDRVSGLDMLRDWRIALPSSLIAILLLFLLLRSAFGAPTPLQPNLPTVSPVPQVPSATLIAPSTTSTATAQPQITVTITPSLTPMPTATLEPSATLPVPTLIPPPTLFVPTETALPPTETALPLTETPTLTITFTAVVTLTPSLTATFAPTVLITSPPATLTSTLVPPSATTISSPTVVATTSVPAVLPTTELPTDTPTATLTPIP